MASIRSSDEPLKASTLFRISKVLGHIKKSPKRTSKFSILISCRSKYHSEFLHCQLGAFQLTFAIARNFSANSDSWGRFPAFNLSKIFKTRGKLANVHTADCGSRIVRPSCPFDRYCLFGQPMPMPAEAVAYMNLPFPLGPRSCYVLSTLLL